MSARLSGKYSMKRVKLDLKNCYGIKSLQREFDYSDTPAYALYAPNGVMKSSLAETFSDAAKGQDSRDRIFQDRETTRKITDESGASIEGERVLVIPSDLLPNLPSFISRVCSG